MSLENAVNRSHNIGWRQRTIPPLCQPSLSAKEIKIMCLTSCRGHWARTCEFVFGEHGDRTASSGHVEARST